MTLARRQLLSTAALAALGLPALARAEEATLKLNQWLSMLESDADGHAPVHASAGSAAHRAGEDAASLYRRADAAMYRAKFSGGRRLVRDGHEEPDARRLPA